MEGRLRQASTDNCLMSNHFHPLIETPDADLSKGMRPLNGVCTRHSNRRHRRKAIGAVYGSGEAGDAQTAEHFGVPFTTLG